MAMQMRPRHWNGPRPPFYMMYPHFRPRPPKFKFMKWHHINKEVAAMRGNFGEGANFYAEDFYARALLEKKHGLMRIPQNSQALNRVSALKEDRSKFYDTLAKKTRTWGKNEKTLGLRDRSDVTRPRKLLQINKADPKSENADDANEPTGLQSLLWTSRSQVEGVFAEIMAVEDTLKIVALDRVYLEFDDPIKHSNLAVQREKLCSALHLNAPMTAEQIEAGETEPVWEGLNMLSILKGKKAICRVLFRNLLAHEQACWLLVVACRYLANFLFSKQATDDFKEVNEQLSKLMVERINKFKPESLGVVAECLEAVDGSVAQHSTELATQMLLFLFKNDISAAVIAALISRGKELKENASSAATEKYDLAVTNLMQKLS